MKSLLFGLTLIGLTTLCHSQVDTKVHSEYLASETDFLLNDPSMYLERGNTSHLIFRDKGMPISKPVKALNANYLEAVTVTVNCERVNALESLVANYDLTKQKFFNNKTKSYDIEFKEGNNHNGSIKVVYDNNGKLISSLESFTDIRLPRPILDAIHAVYPGCIILKNTYKVYYSVKKGTQKLYKVKIDNHGNKAIIKVNNNGDII
ncbi:hypothetical protein [Aestuariibaculum sediminum]|uniref:Uncharacterized protein n=1 Tax=Aestuariibaculum sediminum TaxID=2770637 RepID=A0A8J6Q275_9FLAO|nr:hypothetical protein [Aestuariibaculum sediminum]MBD0831799.1 hypothetical protein [Aestuariibaculum sediminum]